MYLSKRRAGAVAAAVVCVLLSSGCKKESATTGTSTAKPSANAVVSLENRTKAQELVNDAAKIEATGDLRAAREKYREAAALDPTNRTARAGADIVLVSQQDVVRARAKVKEGTDLFKKGEPLQAHRILLEAAKLDPNNRDALMRAAESGRIVRRFDVSRALLEEALLRAPTSIEILSNVALVAYDSGDWQGCLEYCSRIDPLLDANPNYRDNGEFWFMRAWAAKKKELAPETIASLERATRLQPNNAEYHEYLGRALLDDGRFDLADRSFRRSLELRPNSSWCNYHLGRSLQKRGMHAEAVEAFKRALSYDNTQWEWNVDLAHSYELLGTPEDLQRAIAYCDVALHLNPLAHAALFTIGNSLRKLGRGEEAAAYLERFERVKAVSTENEESLRPFIRRIVQNPRDFDAYFRLVEIHTSFKHFDDASNVIRDLLLVDPQNADGLAHSFRLFFSMGDANSARWEASKLIDYHPSDHRGPFFMASIAYQAAKKDEATAFAERAYALNPREFGPVELLMDLYSTNPARKADAQRLYPTYLELKKKVDAEAEELRKKQEEFEKRVGVNPPLR